MKVNPVIFFTSAILAVLFVIYTATFTVQASEVFGQVQSYIVENLGWFYVMSVTIFLVFVIYLLFSRFGEITLGKPGDEPQYSRFSWFAMLFSAGMGIGLLFFSVAEPLFHYSSPPSGTEDNVEAAREAMRITFFHWGLHAWAIYIVIGLSLAYFAYRHDLPLTIRSTLYPILGNRIHGGIGNTVEIIAVFGTLFGIATSLGLGVTQINAGLAHLGWFESNITNQIILIAVITLAATISVFLGLDKGIKRLSEINLVLGLALVLFVFLLGPTTFLLMSYVQGTGAYLSNLVSMSLQTDAYEGPEWQSAWTMFYWGWWISWSPFVGMFIARISRGRSIREFVAGVLLVPTLLTFGWLTIFGNTALYLELNDLANLAGAENVTDTALFLLLSEFPFAALTSVVAVIVIATYFVTSSDSGSLVIDTLTSGGELNTPKWQRVFWALSEGAIAAVLLLAGARAVANGGEEDVDAATGLEALQAAAITTALPFCIIMLAICWSLYRGLSRDKQAKSLSR
ncbi:choline/glycine/proline betaine transport protein [Natronospira proteinivora]|uniref:Choline/glycine/proline betaine transport protein n=1 Tax=Natronospira proteinivora TaxID=1807133 RepID=A0ABT1GAE7_9GAMM|nr:BCCT family transporter [Natronospira proteinivora]MCP1728306.1 choline/glycine/proline betaine transport protein [Natronospira proteinivora]